MARTRDNIMVALRKQGKSFSQIAQEVRVRETFVRAFFRTIEQRARPNDYKDVYRRAALECVLRNKEREAEAISGEIARLREQIDQLTTLELTRSTLQQAIRGGR